MVRDSAAKFLKDNAGIETLRTLAAKDPVEAYESPLQPAPWNEELWQSMVELGWTALAVPEECGGMGMKMVAVAALAEEIGRVALPSPLTATLLAALVLRETRTAETKPWLERIAAGTPASLAITNAQGSWEASDTDVTARTQSEGMLLNGCAAFVQDARKVRLFVVSARNEDGVGLYVVDADQPGVTIRPDHIVDLTRDQATVELSDVEISPTAVVAAGDAGAAALRAALPAMLTVVSADMVGAGEWQLQTTREYASVRTQFDHTLGFFQAVKHPIVNMMLAIDRARSLVYNAACAIDCEPDKAEHFARMAKSSASDAAGFCSGRSLQLHGGIGFTWECDLHLYFKRQKHNQMYLGDGIYHRGNIRFAAR